LVTFNRKMYEDKVSTARENSLKCKGDLGMKTQDYHNTQREIDEHKGMSMYIRGRSSMETASLCIVFFDHEDRDRLF
jgi:hypothetical protein